MRGRMLLKRLVELSESLPGIGLESRMLDSLAKLYPNADRGKYISASILISFLPAFLCMLFPAFFQADVFFVLVSFLAAWLLALGFFLALPSFEVRRRTKLMEAEMPFVLRTIGMLRNMKISFVKCLQMAADEETEISSELKAIVRDINMGMTLDKSLARFSSLFSSYTIKRALSQILSAYEVGSSGIEMRRIGDELLAVQQHELKESASKNAIFGMLFIMTAAVLPTFFLIYVLLGGYGVGGILDRFAIFLAMLLVFPTVSALILLVSKATVPYSPLMPKTSVLDSGVLAGALLFIVSFMIENDTARLVAAAGAITLILLRIYDNHKKERRTEEIEQYLPDAVFSVVALPKSAKMEKIFDMIAQGDYKALSEEALTAKRQLAGNISVDRVLEDLWKRNNSPALRKVCIMLKHAYDTNSLDQLHSIAEDLLKNLEIKRERAALMSMQKYTIMFGAFIIPFILKIAISLVNSLAGFFAAGGAAVTDLLSYILSLIPAYLVIYALISSFYIADIEGKKSRSAVYFLLLSTVSILIFMFFSF